MDTIKRAVINSTNVKPERLTRRMSMSPQIAGANLAKQTTASRESWPQLTSTLTRKTEGSSVAVVSVRQEKRDWGPKSPSSTPATRLGFE